MLVKCNLCKGKGWIKCPQCDKITSKTLKEQEKCMLCKGEQKIPCKGCSGSGFIEMTAFA
jgi:hypothetical protein